MSDRPNTPPLLTSNDLALAEQAAAHAIKFWKDRGRSKFVRRRIDEYRALIAKLDAAGRHLCPHDNSDDMPLDWGSDPIYGPLTKRQQRAAIKGRDA